MFVFLKETQNFNCTIQELKHVELGVEDKQRLFQLHHTGIKTFYWRSGHVPYSNFNCTIQELKHEFIGNYDGIKVNFNCTIQELKRSN